MLFVATVRDCFSLTDDIPELRTEALKLWDDVGKVYMQENENDLKDQMDFLIDDPVHYPPFGKCHRSGRHTVRKNELNNSHNLLSVKQLSYSSKAVCFENI
jgi:hypothetical protein